MKKIGENKCFGGRQLRFQHHSQTLSCDMVFSVYLPPDAESNKVPVLYWLSGLTCNDQNFVQKAGAQRYAAEHGVAIVAPDTSPRGEAVPDDPAGAYDFGLGAGFYVNATQAPWNAHYQMYDYIVTELPLVLKGSSLPVDLSREAISGHSMGGHGAITIALKNPERFRSLSAFAPISSPMGCPWGEKALRGYLGDDEETWAEYDSTALLENAKEKLPFLVDQGDADDFLAAQLKPELLREAAEAANYPIELRIQPGYDHSYFFIGTFIGEHIAFHARHLK
ncbi:S-formylglutathione hydrolase [Proteobacteria bacterium 005FR1]|nr:S-formylglutathione hydrolase [Proteobacteria bacterium 005FR1]